MQETGTCHLCKLKQVSLVWGRNSVRGAESFPLNLDLVNNATVFMIQGAEAKSYSEQCCTVTEEMTDAVHHRSHAQKGLNYILEIQPY